MIFFSPQIIYSFWPKKIVFLTLILSILSPLKAQNHEKGGQGIISGKIIDSLSGAPINYASVGLVSEETSKEINGTTTDEKGFFSIDHVAEGNYKIVIYYIGFKKGTKGNIQISKAKPLWDLGAISLANSRITLQEVTVTSKTQIVENKIDKVVYNVENDVTSQSGAAIDVLKKVPQVNVDIDGNVELQGNSNIRFLINGKPSSMFGSSLADALASIPASQIKSIEAITSPGAKYDAQGTGGIINIILKENKVKGINGSVNLSAGSMYENGGLNLNLRNNNFGINVFLNGNAQLPTRSPNSQYRTSLDSAAQTTGILKQDGYTDAQRLGYRAGIGFEWNPNKKNNFNGSISYNLFSRQNKGRIDQNQLTLDNSQATIHDISSYRLSDNTASITDIDWNLNYKKSFKKEEQALEINYSSSYGQPKSNYLQTQTINGDLNPYAGMSGGNPGTNFQSNISVDYVHPIKEDFIIETGLKAIQQNIQANSNVNFLNTTTGEYENDPLQSYSLNYNMSIYAAYISSTFKLFNWLDVRTGLRFEHTDVKIDFPGAHIPSYDIVAPSAILSHKFKKGNMIKFAYSRRIERADYEDLNPFMNLSDPRNITTGNPALNPEIGDNMELGYSKNFDNGGNLYIGIIERINSQDHKRITTFYSNYLINDSLYTNVSITNWQNIGTEYNSGGMINASYPITEKLNLRGNFMATNRYIVSTIYVGDINMGMRYRLNLNLSYQLPEDLIIEVFGNYNSSAQNIQGKIPQFISYNCGLRKQFWNKKASVGFAATNPFNKYIKQETTVVTGSYNSSAIKYYPNRFFAINFTYKFGKLEFKKGHNDSNEDINQPPPSN